MPNFVGLIQVPSGDGSRATWFESLNERNNYIDLILGYPVVVLAAQPARVVWRLRSGIREHWPDALVELEDGQRLLVDVTRRARLEDPAALAVFMLTAETAAACGWAYEVRTELPAQRARNLRHFWAFRWEPVPNDWDEVSALAVDLQPATVELVSAALGGGALGRSRLWRLIAHRLAFVDLNCPITLQSGVWWTPSNTIEEESWVIRL